MTEEQELEKYWRRDNLATKLESIKNAIDTMQQIYDETEVEYDSLDDEISS